MNVILPISGWCLNQIVELDAYSAGTCGSFFRASSERRQVTAALLSTRPFPSDIPSGVHLASFLQSADHRSILREAFGVVPQGLRGALKRSGPQPHARNFYRKPFEILARGEHHARVVQELDELDLTRLRVIEHLPKPICTAQMVRLIGNERDAKDTGIVFALLTSSGVNAAALSTSLRRARSRPQLAELWERWSAKCTLPAHPVPADENYVPITSGLQLRRMALRYRNCARRYLAEVLDGESAFAEFLHAGRSAVVHLIDHCGQWVVDSLYGKDNGPVPRPLREQAIAYLVGQGVQERYRSHESAGKWRALRRLTRTSMMIDVELE